MNLIRPELARAFENVFGFRGGATPAVPQSVTPVIILDDNSKGPYPARSWQAGANVAALAANFSYVGIKNADPAIPITRSVVVVDYALVISPLPADVVPAITNDASLTMVFVLAEDVTEDKDSAPTSAPPFGNVVLGTVQTGVGVGTQRVPMTGAVQRIDGPWTLGPQGILAFRPLSLNAAITAYFRGRYYAAP